MVEEKIACVEVLIQGKASMFEKQTAGLHGWNLERRQRKKRK